MRKREPDEPSDREVHIVPQLALSHGQTIWLLTELGLHQGVSKTTFNYYIKSLRKLGIPFEKGAGPSKGHRHATYDFEELMELTIALLLRVYGTLPDTVVMGLRNFRGDLHKIYREAYLDSLRKTSSSARVATPNGDRMIAVDGLFLDLNIRYSAGHMIEFGPPKAMSPFEAVDIFVRSEIPARSYLPLNVTAIAKSIVGRTQVVPTILRGRAARRSITS